ncbi:MAG: DUF3431 domain-containing protein [Kiritimatiellae bacterium]|nr:DUF3431 domain-containing protein [Kiritimatiellia bacterium]
MQAFELVVARYDEDLKWLRRVPRDFRITVYDKGAIPPPPFHFPLSAFPLPNVGHEAHTYLHHIVTRYNDLAELTVFCQGKPFDHVPDFHRTLRRLARGHLTPPDFLWLGFVIDRDDRAGSLFRRWHPDRTLPMDEFWSALWNTHAPEHVVFYPGAHFAVTAETVRSQPLNFYRNALEVSGSLPDAGHCFERCWDRVFGVDGIPAEYRHAELPVYFRPIRRLGLTWAHVRDVARASRA